MLFRLLTRLQVGLLKSIKLEEVSYKQALCQSQVRILENSGRSISLADFAATLGQCLVLTGVSEI